MMKQDAQQHDRMGRPSWRGAWRWASVASVVCAVVMGCATAPWSGGWPVQGFPPKFRSTTRPGDPTTFYERQRRMRSIAAGASRLDSAEQERIAGEMNELLRTDPNPLLRLEAVRVLSGLRTPTALTGLQLAESDADLDVREAACVAFGARRDRASLDALARMLANDESQDVRLAATRELANYRDAAAYRALLTALTDDDPALQNRAIDSLRHASGRDYGGDLERWRTFVETGDAEPLPPQSVAERIRDLF